ncbi:hypothetical protein ACU686_30925 [Yinghuangia aomiensis]
MKGFAGGPRGDRENWRSDAGQGWLHLAEHVGDPRRARATCGSPRPHRGHVHLVGGQLRTGGESGSTSGRTARAVIRGRPVIHVDPTPAWARSARPCPDPPRWRVRDPGRDRRLLPQGDGVLQGSRATSKIVAT